MVWARRRNAATRAPRPRERPERAVRARRRGRTSRTCPAHARGPPQPGHGRPLLLPWCHVDGDRRGPRGRGVPQRHRTPRARGRKPHERGRGTRPAGPGGPVPGPLRAGRLRPPGGGAPARQRCGAAVRGGRPPHLRGPGEPGRARCGHLRLPAGLVPGRGLRADRRTAGGHLPAARGLDRRDARTRRHRGGRGRGARAAHRPGLLRPQLPPHDHPGLLRCARPGGADRRAVPRGQGLGRGPALALPAPQRRGDRARLAQGRAPSSGGHPRRSGPVGREPRHRVRRRVRPGRARHRRGHRGRRGLLHGRAALRPRGPRDPGRLRGHVPGGAQRGRGHRVAALRRGRRRGHRLPRRGGPPRARTCPSPPDPPGPTPWRPALLGPTSLRPRPVIRSPIRTTRGTPSCTTATPTPTCPSSPSSP